MRVSIASGIPLGKARIAADLMTAAPVFSVFVHKVVYIFQQAFCLLWIILPYQFLDTVFKSIIAGREGIHSCGECQSIAADYWKIIFFLRRRCLYFSADFFFRYSSIWLLVIKYSKGVLQSVVIEIQSADIIIQDPELQQSLMRKMF